MADKEDNASGQSTTLRAATTEPAPIASPEAEKDDKNLPPTAPEQTYSSRQSRAPSSLPPLSLDSPPLSVPPTQPPQDPAAGSPLTPLILLLALPTSLFLAVDLSLAYFRSPTPPAPAPTPPPSSSPRPPSWAWKAFKRVLGFGGSGKSVPHTAGANTAVGSKWTVGGMVWGASAAVVLAVVVARAVTIWAGDEIADDSAKSKDQEVVEEGDKKQESLTREPLHSGEAAGKPNEGDAAIKKETEGVNVVPPIPEEESIHSDPPNEKESKAVVLTQDLSKSAHVDRANQGDVSKFEGNAVSEPISSTSSSRRVISTRSEWAKGEKNGRDTATPKDSAESSAEAMDATAVAIGPTKLPVPKPEQPVAEWPTRAESLFNRNTESPVTNLNRVTTSSDLPPRIDSLANRKSQQDLSSTQSSLRPRSPSPPPDNVVLPGPLPLPGSPSPRTSRPLPTVPSPISSSDSAFTPPDSPGSSRRARSRSKPRPLPSVPGIDSELSDFGKDVLQSIGKMGSAASLDSEPLKSSDEVHPGVLEVVAGGGLQDLIVSLGSEGEVGGVNNPEHEEHVRIPMRRGRTSDQIEYSASGKFALTRKAEIARPVSMIEPGTTPRIPASATDRRVNRGRPITMHASPLHSEAVLITIPPKTLRHLTLPLHPNPHNITTLNLSSNYISHLPPELFLQSPYLQHLDLTNCHLESIPGTIGNCTELREINLTSNFLKGLCREIGDLRGLEKLFLAGNSISFLENTLFTMTLSLSDLDISGNKLRHLPPSLGLLHESLVQLKLKDNPFDPTLEKLIAPLSELEAKRDDMEPTGTPGNILSGEKQRSASVHSGGDTGRAQFAPAPPPRGTGERASSGGDALYQQSRGSVMSITSNRSVSTEGSEEGGDADLGKEHVTSPTTILTPTSPPGWQTKLVADTASVDTKSTLVDDWFSRGSSDMESGISLGMVPIRFANNNVFLQRLLGHLRDAYELDPLIFPDNNLEAHDRPSGAQIVRLASGFSDTASISSQLTAEEEAKAKKKLVPGMREKVAMEMVITERTYVRELQSLVDIYLSPLEAAAKEKGEEILTPQEIALVFSNVRSVLMFHRDHVLPDLEKCLADPNQPLGSALLKMSPFLKMYQMYYNTFDAANTYATTLETAFKTAKASSVASRSSTQPTLPPGTSPITKPKAKKFRHFLRKCKTHSRHTQISLQAFLILPVQRLPRYKLLTEELLSRTPPDHPDWVNLTKAVESIKKRVDECNEGKRVWEERRGGAAVLSRIKVKAWSIGGGILKGVMGRKFVREGRVNVLKWVEASRGEGGWDDTGLIDVGMALRGRKEKLRRGRLGTVVETRLGVAKGDEDQARIAKEMEVCGPWVARCGVAACAGKVFWWSLFEGVVFICTDSESGTDAELVVAVKVSRGGAEVARVAGGWGAGETGVGSGIEAVGRVRGCGVVVYFGGRVEDVAGWVSDINTYSE